MDWDNRRERFEWANGLEYYCGPKESKKQVVHVIVC